MPPYAEEKWGQGSMKIVMIEWTDACGGGSSWTELKDIETKLAVNLSVGWLLQADAEKTTVVPNLSWVNRPKSDGCGEMTIPTNAITKIVTLSDE